MTDNTQIERPLVTFALFTYNQEDYIREAVEGAFSQTYEPLEIILSDDCSTDRTYEIINDMVKGYDGPHIVRVNQTPENQGKSNFGKRIRSILNACNGEFIVLAAGDDVSVPSRTTTLFNAWDEGGRRDVCVHSKATVIDACSKKVGQVGDNNIGSITLERFIAQDGRGLLGATNSISRTLLSKFGPIPDVFLLEDGVLAFRAKLCDGIEFVPKALVRYRRHSSNITSSDPTQNPELHRRYVRGLAGQHSSYLNDYIACRLDQEDAVLRAIISKLRELRHINRLHSTNQVSRILAYFYLGRRFSIKRRIWLTLKSLTFFQGRGG